MGAQPTVVTLSEAEREQALARFRLLQPFLEGQVSLSAIAREHDIPLRTAQQWVAQYRQQGLVGLVRRRRSDRGQRRMEPELQQLIEGLALQKTRLTAAAIHRQVAKIATQQGWAAPSYRCVYDIVHSLDPAMVLLAHEGGKAYQNVYDLVHRRQADRPNQIWQADHTPLDIFLLNDEGQPARPWLTIVEDDYSRCIAGYFVTFAHPNALNTALALRQAIWRKLDPRWRICGIPERFYTDHGSDFTSQHIEQVCIDLEIQLIFSMAGMPRGRGRIERFFQTVSQLLLCQLSGYAPASKAVVTPTMTLEAFDAIFQEFLLDEYHVRSQRDISNTPQQRWERAVPGTASGRGFLPRMPESLEELDLLLLTVARTRRVHRDGIRFQSLRYIDSTLAAYVGESVVIRYDPRDMAEIRVFYGDTFLCRAICPELAGQTVSLKEIVRARNRRRRELKQQIQDREELVRAYLKIRQGEPASSAPSPPIPQTARPTRSLKLYQNE